MNNISSSTSCKRSLHDDMPASPKKRKIEVEDKENTCPNTPQSVSKSKAPLSPLTPTKWFASIEVIYRGRKVHKFILPKNFNCQAIYVFKNTITGERYVGKADHLIERLKSHESGINNSNGSVRRKNPRQRLYAMVENAPHSVLFGVRHAKPGESPRKLEKEAETRYRNKGIDLLNLTDCGGGPKSKKKLTYYTGP